MSPMLMAILSSSTSSLTIHIKEPLDLSCFSVLKYCARCDERFDTFGKSKTTVAGIYSFNLSAPKAEIRAGELTNPSLSSTALSESIPASTKGSSCSTLRPIITLTDDMMMDFKSTSAT